MNKIPSRCRRGHRLAGDNLRMITNSHTTAKGRRKKYRTRLCRKCAQLRAHARSKGKALPDMRKGR